MLRVNATGTRTITIALFFSLGTIVLISLLTKNSETVKSTFNSYTKSSSSLPPNLREYSVKGTIYDVDVPTKDVGPYYPEWKNPEGDMPAADKLDDRLPSGFNPNPSSNDPTMTSFMYRSNDSSRLTNLFTSHKNAVQICDNDTSIAGCTARTRSNNGYDMLSVKLIESLSLFCASPVKTDIYAKIDDDTIISQDELELLARKLYHSDCSFISSHISLDYKFYWGVGEIYMFKKSILDRACEAIPSMVVGTRSEDMLMGQLINSRDTHEFCNLDAEYSHRSYDDNRVKIEYKVHHS